MPTAENRSAALRFLEEVINGRRLSALDELVAPEAVNNLRQAVGMSLLLTAFPDFRLDVTFTVAADEIVVCQSTWTGTHQGAFEGLAPSGRRVKVPRADVFRFARGRIIESWHSDDHAELLRQLGGGPPPGGAPEEPVLEVAEIQGNSLAGFNKNYQTFLFMQIIDPAAAKAWLRDILPHIATLEEVVNFNNLYKELRRRRGGVFGAIQSTWVNIAFSFGGLRKLTPEADLFTERAFREGMHARSALLGDEAGTASDAAPDNWLVGGPRNVPDLLVVVAADDRRCSGDEAERIRRSLGGGLRVIYEQRGENPPEPLTGHEHFGFRDGISQPGVRGRLSAAPRHFLTRRQNPSDPHQGKPGQDLIWPGEFVFGYPTQDPTDLLRPGPVADAGPPWGRNGSFLVFRRYRQDVGGFRQFLQSEARRLAKRYPALSALTPEQLGAKLMGRWASGAPVMRAPEADNPEIPRDNCADNHFRFVAPSRPVTGDGGQCTDSIFPPSPGDDPGLICPHAAHIRKAYPRDDPAPGGRPRTNTHRLLRRGIPFGRPFPAEGERGLLFLAYQTSIERQFEFVVRHWLNNPDFRDAGDGFDPIIGQNGDGAGRERTFKLPFDDGGRARAAIIELPAEWAVPTGGAYLFSPSISALRHLSRG